MAAQHGYVYSLLKNRRTIRLINLASEVTAAGLFASLQELNLNHEPLPSYSALSYCWEGQKADCPIICDNATLNITKNCHDAMLKLREVDKPAALWIRSVEPGRERQPSNAHG